MEADGDGCAKDIEQAREDASLFAHGNKDFARRAIIVKADCDEAFVRAYLELVGEGFSFIGHSSPSGGIGLDRGY